ncbi:MAG: hypothetical protein OK436_05350 [Thaumarchaeota archaeon]|nr:hypothetical protein [Nitrososphaerota archaeon]
MSKRENAMERPALVLALALFVLLAVSTIPYAFALTTEISTSNGSATCPAIGGTWNPITHTCTVSSDYIVAPGDTLQIDFGVTLLISPGPGANGGLGGISDFGGTGGVGTSALTNSGAVLNFGILQVTGSVGGVGGIGGVSSLNFLCFSGAAGGGGGGGAGGNGIKNVGTISNSGQIKGVGGAGGDGGLGGSGSSSGGTGGSGGQANSPGTNGGPGGSGGGPLAAGGPGGTPSVGGGGGGSGSACASGAGGGGGGGGYDVVNLGTITNCGGTVTGMVTGTPPVTGTCTTPTTTTTTSSACVPTTVTVTQTLASTPEFSSGGGTMLAGVAIAFALVALMALRRRGNHTEDATIQSSPHLQ